MYEEYLPKNNRWKKVVDALARVLQEDPLINKRPVNLNTNKPQLLNTNFFIMKTSEAVLEELSLTSKDVTALIMPSPMVCIFPGRSFKVFDKITRPNYKPDLAIDVMISNPELSRAQEDALNFAFKISECIDDNRNLNFKVADCYIEDIQDWGFRKEYKLPYEYFYRLFLNTKTS